MLDGREDEKGKKSFDSYIRLLDADMEGYKMALVHLHNGTINAEYLKFQYQNLIEHAFEMTRDDGHRAAWSTPERIKETAHQIKEIAAIYKRVIEKLKGESRDRKRTR